MVIRLHLYLIRLACLGFLVGFALPGEAQPTIGTTSYNVGTQSGYNLLVPMTSKETYLLDNCGQIVRQWSADDLPGLSAYLLEDGSLLRTARIGTAGFDAGGSAGRMERYDWNGIRTWRFDVNSDTGQQHHDIAALPNGNVLVLVWEKHLAAEAIAKGRDPGLLLDELWSEVIYELQPIGIDQAAVVWSWHLWDHLVQNHDPTAPSFDDPANRPERVNLNYFLPGSPLNYKDWTHANSIDYNADLDQILLSVKNFHEAWVIDHSTTTAEAAGSSGGLRGKGGDLLYRWGNPRAYGRGDAPDQVFYEQHDAQWVPAGYPGAGNITVFNNGRNRPGGDYSTVEEFTPPVASDGSYTVPATDAFGPATVAWNYTASPPTAMYSTNLSGAQRQPNGTTLVCAGATGEMLEVNNASSLVWSYRCPVGIGGPATQGSIPTGNQVFRLRRYAPDYAAFDSKTLLPGDPIQIESAPFICDEPVGIGLSASAEGELRAGPNPFHHALHWQTGQPLAYRIADALGRVRAQGPAAQNVTISTATWPAGMYWLQLIEANGQTRHSMPLIKL